MLRKLYIKELKDSFRDRRTLLLSVLLPIIMMTGLTLYYEYLLSDGKEETFQLAVPTQLDDEIKTNISVYPNIEIKSSKDPEQMVQEGNAQAAILIDDQFSEKINSGSVANITIIGDSFSQSSSTLISLVTNALNQWEKTVVSQRLEAADLEATLIQPLSIVQKEISAEDPNINLVALLIPLILVLSISVGASPAAYDLFAGEKEKKTMEALLITPVNRSKLVFSKWLTISTIGTITGFITLVVVIVEIAFFTENLRQAVPINDNFILIILFAIVLAILYSMFIASILMLTSIIGKTIKEAQSYSTPIMMLTILPLMLISSIGINELTTKHFIIPFLNIFAILKELIFGIINYEHILISIASNLICMLIIFFIGRTLFLKDKWVIS